MVPAGDHDETPHVWTRDYVLWNVDGSLKKMRSDHVDLLRLRNATVEQIEAGNLVDVLRGIQATRRTRFIGASTISPQLATFIS